MALANLRTMIYRHVSWARRYACTVTTCSTSCRLTVKASRSVPLDRGPMPPCPVRAPVSEKLVVSPIAVSSSLLSLSFRFGLTPTRNGLSGS